MLSSCLIWQIISFILPPNEYGCVYAWITLESGPAIDLQKMPILAKKNHLFRWSSFWSWLVCKQANCGIWGTEKPYAYIEKPKHPKRVTVCGGFWSRGIIGPFFFENEQWEEVTVNGDRYGPCCTNFCSQKLKKKILASFGFNKTALRVTQPKIVLSAAELMSFGYLRAAIWHRWTIICEVPSKISVSPTSQRQLTL